MKKAFTLAEVLITLGIIGVVSTITIPTLITKYKANKLRTKLVKANAIIQQAVMRMEADEINIDEVINKGEYQTIHSYFKNGGCKLPTSVATANYKNYLGKAPTLHAADSTLLSSYCLFDGMVLWIGRINDKQYHKLFGIDINGWKNKPDRYGQDVFFWVYNPDTQTIIPLGENDNIKGFKTYYSKCPGSETAEMGIACTYKALNDKKYFDKLPK